VLKKFFLICSGVDLNLIQNCSNGEQNKYVGIGATVFFTAVMATIASSHALYTVFDNFFTSIFFGVVWGLLIFNLDRFIVSTMKKYDSKRKEILQATPRILLAIIIAVVISKPLELKIFEKEINQVLLTQKNDMTLQNKTQITKQYEPEIVQLQNEINTLKEEVNNKELEVNNLYETYIAEAEGRKGTLKIGKGPVYKEKREKHDAALKELSNLKNTTSKKIEIKEQAIAKLQSNREKSISNTQPIISNFDGLMARINALGKLPLLPSLFIFLLFLAIETTPIFAKLVSPKGELDFKLEDQEPAIKGWVSQQVLQRKTMEKSDLAINKKIYSNLEEDQDIYDYKYKKAKQIMTEQADAFYKKQQKLL